MAKNGRLPATALATVPGTTQRIAVVLLAQLVALRAAFYASFGRTLTITDAYRSYARQVYLRGRYLARLGAYAVRPGTSNHGWGLAVDFGAGVQVLGSAEHQWMVANAPRYGFVWLATAGDGTTEAWHFDGTPVPATTYTQTPVPVPVPTAQPPLFEEDDMIALITFFYVHLMGRQPSAGEVYDRIGEFSGWSPIRIRDWFLASRAEPGTVVQAFREYLGSDPSPAQIAECANGRTVAQARAYVAGSPDALARR